MASGDTLRKQQLVLLPLELPQPHLQPHYYHQILTPIYSSSPSYNEWIFCDQLAHSHIILNVLDSIRLGVKTDRTVKECWDSIIAEHAKKTNIVLSEAEASLNAAKFDSNSDINTRVSDLHTK